MSVKIPKVTVPPKGVEKLSTRKGALELVGYLEGQLSIWGRMRKTFKKQSYSYDKIVADAIDGIKKLDRDVNYFGFPKLPIDTEFMRKLYQDLLDYSQHGTNTERRALIKTHFIDNKLLQQTIEKLQENDIITKAQEENFKQAKENLEEIQNQFYEINKKIGDKNSEYEKVKKELNSKQKEYKDIVEKIKKVAKETKNVELEAQAKEAELKIKKQEEELKKTEAERKNKEAEQKRAEAEQKRAEAEREKQEIKLQRQKEKLEKEKQAVKDMAGINSEYAAKGLVEELNNCKEKIAIKKLENCIKATQDEYKDERIFSKLGKLQICLYVTNKQAEFLKNQKKNLKKLRIGIVNNKYLDEMKTQQTHLSYIDNTVKSIDNALSKWESLKEKIDTETTRLENLKTKREKWLEVNKGCMVKEYKGWNRLISGILMSPPRKFTVGALLKNVESATNTLYYQDLIKNFKKITGINYDEELKKHLNTMKNITRTLDYRELIKQLQTNGMIKAGELNKTGVHYQLFTSDTCEKTVLSWEGVAHKFKSDTPFFSLDLMISYIYESYMKGEWLVKVDESGDGAYVSDKS